MPGCELSRRHPSNHSVRSHLLVILTPDGDDLAGLCRRCESALVEAFASELAIEALEVGVLPGFAWLDQDVLTASRLQSRHEGSACELRSALGHAPC